MTAVKISLNSIDKVKSFCNDIAKFDAEFDLVSGRYVIDAKSIMGIFSLDISLFLALPADHPFWTAPDATVPHPAQQRQDKPQRRLKET